MEEDGIQTKLIHVNLSLPSIGLDEVAEYNSGQEGK
jgi:hypothetical protein